MFMRKICTRLASIFLILIVAVSFSACSLFTTDLDKKYSATVKVMTMANSDLSVSRQELYHAYIQWGYQYASYFENSEDLLEYIAESLLNDKILEQYSVEQFGELRASENALALKQAYQSLDQTLRSYIYEAMEMEDNSSQEESDEKDEVDKPYTPSIFVTANESGERIYTLNLSSYEDLDQNGVLRETDFACYIPNIPGVALSSNGNSKYIRQSISKIVRNLQTFENGFTKLKKAENDYLKTADGESSEYFKYLTSTERDVLNREIDRMVKLNRTSILVNRLNTAYNLGFFTLAIKDPAQLSAAYKNAWDEYLTRSEDFEAWCNKINGIKDDNAAQPAYFGCGRDIATNIAKEVIYNYQTKLSNAIANNQGFPNSDLEKTIMQSGLADVYYIPQAAANNLFTVSHILIGFTDEQKSLYQHIQTEAEKNPSYNAENDLNDLYANTASNGVSASKIWGEVKTALDRTDSLQEKYHIFREYINQYNSDPGMQNLEQLDSNSKPQHEYLMSKNAENNNMVETFTEASIDLFNDETPGAISNLVWSEYGAHIIMYTRNVSDFIYTSLGDVKQNYEKTLFATLTSYGQRTMFDTMVDSYGSRSYSDYRNAKLKEYKHENQVTLVQSELKSFFK